MKSQPSKTVPPKGTEITYQGPSPIYRGQRGVVTFSSGPAGLVAMADGKVISVTAAEVQS